MTIAKNQIKIIHVLAKKLGIDRDIYEAMLGEFGATSCKDLTFIEATEFIRRLNDKAEAAGVQEPRRKPYTHRDYKRFNEFAGRPGYASPAQLRKIEAMWMGVSYQKTPKEKRAALNHFLRNKYGISRLEWITVSDVAKIIRTIAAMKK